jgi:hypothetical protein
MNQLRERQMELGRVVFSNDGDASDRLLVLLQRLVEAVERIEQLLARQERRHPDRLDQHITQKG